MVHIVASYENRLQWGSLIKSLSFADAFTLMQQIRKLCIRNNTCPNPAYHRPFACAFASLMGKIQHEKDPAHSHFLDKFHFTMAFLQYCTDLCSESYYTTEEQTQGGNIMLEVAGKHSWYEWAHYIYDQMISNNSADAVTYGTAIKIFGREGAFSATEEVFSRFLSLDNLTTTQMSHGYGSMIYTCIRHKKLDRAWEIFDIARTKNISNVFILTSMISVAGRSGRIREACEFYADVLNSPDLPRETARQAKIYFDQHVIHPDKTTLLRTLQRRRDRAAPSCMMLPAVETDSFEKNLQLPSPHDPVYLPQNNVIKKDYGVIGDHLPAIRQFGTSINFYIAPAHKPRAEQKIMPKSYAACLK